VGGPGQEYVTWLDPNKGKGKEKTWAKINVKSNITKQLAIVKKEIQMPIKCFKSIK
jgi:hypothetical protein